MKTTGIVRRLDSLGRIVLPIELRRTLEIMEKDPIEIFTTSEGIVLKKFKESCYVCNSKANLKNYKEKNICTDCIQFIKIGL